MVGNPFNSYVNYSKYNYVVTKKVLRKRSWDFINTVDFNLIYI